MNENLYGAMAARRNGAIVTVEKIVSTDFIRRHANLVRLPAQYVRAVVETPHGNHPGGMYGMNVPELEGYAEDIEWILECRRAFRKPETADAWIKEWMLDLPDHAAYLAKLGYARIMETKGRAHTDAWVSELETLSSRLPRSSDTASPSEWMVVCGRADARGEGARARLQDLPGRRGQLQPGRLAGRYELKQAGVDVEIMAETGMVGYLPRPAEPFVFSFRNFPSCKMLTDILHVMGIFMGGRHNQCLGSLAAGQIDKHGNINSTIIPGVTYVTGSGGANDITSSAREVVVCLEQSPRRFVDKVPYITAPGRTVRTVVSDLGRLREGGGARRAPADRPLRRRAGGRGRCEAARAACGWDLAGGAAAPPLRGADGGRAGADPPLRPTPLFPWRMIGIVSAGGYVPRYRLSAKTLASVWGSGGSGERAVANYDEDSLTMAAEAALNALHGRDVSRIGACFFASTTPPYLEKSSATLLATVADLGPAVLTADFGGSLRCGTTALRLALDTVKAGIRDRGAGGGGRHPARGPGHAGGDPDRRWRGRAPGRQRRRHRHLRGRGTA